MIRLLLLFVICLTLGAATQDERLAYQLFDEQGQRTSYQKLRRAAAEADVVLFGEFHNNTLIHWLQLQLLKDLHADRPGQVRLGAEMFEADNQLLFDEYQQGLIAERHLEAEAKLWNNYATDYKPLVQWATAQGVPVLATNVPRRYAALVARRGLAALDSLGEGARAYMAPLPLAVNYDLPAYQKMQTMMGGHGEAHSAPSARQMVAAQALKDATMAYFILQNHQPGQVVLHLNGSYHSDGFEGIGWYLQRARPDLRVLTISMVDQADLSAIDTAAVGIAHFVFALPADMTKSY